MAYKRTKAVEDIYKNISNYLHGMSLAGKNPSKLHLTSKQYRLLLEDKNKLRKSENLPEIHELGKIRGYDVAIYNG